MNKKDSSKRPNDRDPGILRKKGKPNPDTDLFVFGYSCKLFRDDAKAKEMDQGKQLIPWMGDESTTIDRYDARGHLSERSQFEKTSDENTLTEDEKKIEDMCNEERYRALEQNEEESEMYQEEELKRLKKALSHEYAQVGYNYPETQDASQAKLEEEESEPFVPDPTLDIPINMKLPTTYTENQRIEKTALIVSSYGPQVEILIKTRQAHNHKLNFMHLNNPLNPYYNFIVAQMKAGRYRPGRKPQSNTEENASGEENDHYLHPSLLSASSSTSVESAPSIPNLPIKPSSSNIYYQLMQNIKGMQQNEESLENAKPEPSDLPVPGTLVSSPKPDFQMQNGWKSHVDSKSDTDEENEEPIKPKEPEPEESDDPPSGVIKEMKRFIKKLVKLGYTKAPFNLLPEPGEETDNFKWAFATRYHKYNLHYLKLCRKNGLGIFGMMDLSDVANADKAKELKAELDGSSLNQDGPLVLSEDDLVLQSSYLYPGSTIPPEILMETLTWNRHLKGRHNVPPPPPPRPPLVQHGPTKPTTPKKAPVSFSIKKTVEKSLDLTTFPVESSSEEEEEDEDKRTSEEKKPTEDKKSSSEDKMDSPEDRVEKKPAEESKKVFSEFKKTSLDEQKFTQEPKSSSDSNRLAEAMDENRNKKIRTERTHKDRVPKIDEEKRKKKKDSKAEDAHHLPKEPGKKNIEPEGSGVPGSSSQRTIPPPSSGTRQKDSSSSISSNISDKKIHPGSAKGLTSNKQEVRAKHASNPPPRVDQTAGSSTSARVKSHTTTSAEVIPQATSSDDKSSATTSCTNGDSQSEFILRVKNKLQSMIGHLPPIPCRNPSSAPQTAAGQALPAPGEQEAQMQQVADMQKSPLYSQSPNLYNGKAFASILPQQRLTDLQSVPTPRLHPQKFAQMVSKEINAGATDFTKGVKLSEIRPIKTVPEDFLNILSAATLQAKKEAISSAPVSQLPGSKTVTSSSASDLTPPSVAKSQDNRVFSLDDDSSPAQSSNGGADQLVVSFQPKPKQPQGNLMQIVSEVRFRDRMRHRSNEDDRDFESHRRKHSKKHKRRERKDDDNSSDESSRPKKKKSSSSRYDRDQPSTSSGSRSHKHKKKSKSRTMPLSSDDDRDEYYHKSKKKSKRNKAKRIKSRQRRHQSSSSESSSN